jgi:methanol metabolism-related c-type cytochrome
MGTKATGLQAGTSTLAAMLLLLCGAIASRAADDDANAVKEDDGKYYDRHGNPTFKIESDGSVDWYTYSGYRRYHSDCHVCHGPDGEGSSYAPALATTLKTMSYVPFRDRVINGRSEVNTAQQTVMPTFGLNRNVMCYLDDIFIYLRARANGLPRGRPEKHADKPKPASEAEDSCLALPR